jgi:hypothetical protein
MKVALIFLSTLVIAGNAMADPILLAPATGTVGATNFSEGGGPGPINGLLPESTVFEEGLDAGIAEALGVGPATIVQNGFPVLGPVVDASANGPLFASATADYEFTISGPANTLVPIDVSGFVFTALENTPPPPVHTQASAFVTIYDLTTDSLLLDVAACDGNDCNPVVTFTDFNKRPLMVTSSDIYDVQLGAIAFPDAADQFAGLGSLAQAIADPYIEINSAFAAANPGFSLEFSAGVENVQSTATPEPSYAILPLVGIMLAVTVFKRKRGNFGVELSSLAQGSRA